jgi:hypothetical protein
MRYLFHLPIQVKNYDLGNEIKQTLILENCERVFLILMSIRKQKDGRMNTFSHASRLLKTLQRVSQKTWANLITCESYC